MVPESIVERAFVRNEVFVRVEEETIMHLTAGLYLGEIGETEIGEGVVERNGMPVRASLEILSNHGNVFLDRTVESVDGSVCFYNTVEHTRRWVDESQHISIRTHIISYRVYVSPKSIFIIRCDVEYKLQKVQL